MPYMYSSQTHKRTGDTRVSPMYHIPAAEREKAQDEHAIQLRIADALRKEREKEVAEDAEDFFKDPLGWLMKTLGLDKALMPIVLIGGILLLVVILK